MIIEDVLDSIRSAETRLLDADGRVALWHTLQDAMAEIKRLRGLLGSATLSAATEDKPVAWSVLESPHSLLFFDGEETAREVAFRAGVGAMPLYRKPQPALTDAEREAVEKSERMARLEGYDNEAATLRGLLHRLG
jgi:hypothetical protein